MSELGVSQPLSLTELPLRRTRTRLGALHVSERRILLMVGDLLAISAALGIAVWVRIPGLSEAYANWRLLFIVELRWWLLLWGLWVPLSIAAGCYDLRLAASVTSSSVYTSACALAVAVLYFLVPWVSAPLTMSRLTWLIFALLSAASVTLWRTFFAAFLTRKAFTRRALIVGASEAGQAMAVAVDNAGDASGIDLVGFIDDDSTSWGKRVRGRPILAGSEQLLALTRGLEIDELVVAADGSRAISQDMFRALVRSWELGVDVLSMSLFFEEVMGAIPVDHIGRNLFALVDSHRGFELRIWGWLRRLVDIVVGAMGLALLGLFLPVIAMGIWLDCRGPIFYWQERVGRGGHTFRLYKFRSMIPNAEKDGAVWCKPGDSRITRVGRLLRSSRVDELPQLWNVLKGDMTLIGPRPERPEFVRELGELLPYYAIRHSIKPGITGWAQVRYHYGSSVDDATEKLQYDLYYVKRRGPVLDALIVLLTLRVVATMQGT